MADAQLTQRKPKPKRVRAVVQAVIEVPMSRRQALLAVGGLVGQPELPNLREVQLTGHSILRGLTFIELLINTTASVKLPDVAANVLTLLIMEAEGISRGDESDEFTLRFAEVFPLGRPHEPERVLLDAALEGLGIGGTSERDDERWARLLSRHYNPPARPPGEVKVTRRPLG